MKLVIVESPAKAKTIEKFLGPDYRVEASYGHVRDLPKNARELPAASRKESWADFGVDVDNGFKPHYVVPPDSQRRIAQLAKLVPRATELLLATDEDREGESISWHVSELVTSGRNQAIPVRRIVFHEITKSAVDAALASPRDLDMRLVEAQEARRILDRLYGYSLSPVLWKRVRRGLSAGRVQSVALRLVVDRERERWRFKVAEYWRVKARLAVPTDAAQSAPAAPDAPGDSAEGEDREFEADLVRIGDKRIAGSGDFDPTTGKLKARSRAVVLDEEAAQVVVVGCQSPDAMPWRIASVETKPGRRTPPPPFTTSTLQQAASNRLRMSPKRTMRIAQQLYEGVALGAGEREGLVTYMRTDSVTLSRKALSDAKRHVVRVHGAEYHKARQYKTKSKAAQEAHEAVRPTEIGRTPDQVARFLNKDQLALYRLIWTRAVASQMADARVERTTASLSATVQGVEHVFQARGTVVRFDGFLKVWSERGRKDDPRLPAMAEGAEVQLENRARESAGSAPVLRSLEPRRRETKPPPRYTEASLVKKLEEEGIGRPSTYEPTLSKIQDRDYVQRRSGALAPTWLGVGVNQFLCTYFPQYVDLKFTARMEDALDDIAAGKVQSQAFLHERYHGTGDRKGLRRDVAEADPDFVRIEYPYPIENVGGSEADESGESAKVRIGIGRHTAFAERGEGDQREFATIPDPIVDELTPERLAELFAARAKGDDPLGYDPDTGLPVFVKVGRWGPYAQLGRGRGQPTKPKVKGLPKDTDVAAVTLDEALRFLSLPRTLGADPETGEEVTAGLGYAPFVKKGKEYRNLDSVDQVFTITLEQALALHAQPKTSGSRNRLVKALGAHPQSGAEVEVLKGRYGPYVTDGKVNATLPKDRDPEEIGMEEAVALLAAKAARAAKKPRKTRGSRRSPSRRPAPRRR